MWTAIVAVVIANKPEKKFRDVKRIWTHGPHVSATVLYQFSYEDPNIETVQFVEFILTREWNENNEDDVEQ